MITRMTLLRHGQSEGNANNILQGQSEWPLSELGRHQAGKLADSWADSGVTFAAIISSPLMRALDTAKRIAARLDCLLEEDPRLMERKWGQLEGRPLTEMQDYFQEHPDLALFDCIPPDGESFWQLYSRAGLAMQDILRREPADYLVVSHGGLLAAMHMIALQIAPSVMPLSSPRFSLDNCGFSTLEYDHESPRWVLQHTNVNPNSSNQV